MDIRMKRGDWARTIGTGVVLLATAALGGCSGPFKVTDPASGRVFYTKSVDQNSRAGYVEFTDAVSGSRVTLQSSEVKEVTSDEYNAAVKKPK